MNYRLQNAEKTSDFTINAHQKCLKFDDKTPKNALKFMQKMRQIFSELSVWRLRPKFYLKKPCVSLFVVGVLRCGLEFNIKRNFVFFVAFLGIFTSALKAVDYTAHLPSTIELSGGTSQTSNAIAECNHNGCTFGYNQASDSWYNFTYKTKGNEDSTLILNAQLPPNPTKQEVPFFVSTLTIEPQSNLVLNGFESLSVNAIKINSGSLSYSHNTATSGFGTYGSVSLNNAKFDIKAGKFTNNGTITANNKSTLKINSIGGNNTNNYGTITNDKSTITIQNDLWNLGQKPALGGASPSSVATITNTDGTITIGGNLYNGGQNFSNNVRFCQIGFCGGGNIIINGGTVSVGGKLVSKGEDGQKSSIQIYGGTLIVKGGLENKQDSTLTFGIGSNNEMGKLQGNLSNENGATINVDMTKTQAGKTYRVLQGALSGANQNVNFINNANPQFITASYKDGIVSVFQTGTTPPDPNPNPDPNPTPQPPSKFETYKNNLPSNEKGILNAISSKFGGDDTLLTSVENIETSLADADKSVRDNLISQPKNMLAAFKGDVLLAPMSQGRFVARRLAASGAVRFDNGRRVRALQAKPNVEFQLAPVGGVMKSADANGVLAGLSLGANYKMGAFTHKTSLAYAYGTAKQDLSTQSTETKAHLLQAGVLSLYKYGIYETEFNANLLFGSFTIDNKWTERSLNSSSKFNNYELNLGLVAGARYGKKLSFKPFVGVQNYGQRQDGFVGILGFESKAYNAYILDGVLGVQMQYVRSAFSSVYGKVSFERRLYNTHKFVFLRSGDNELKYENQSYESVVSAALGAQLLTYKRFKLNAEGFLRHYDTGLNYYGGSLVMRYRF